jgi:hypothetical protein
MYVSGDPNNETLLHTASHTGWIVALLAATWGILLRALVGRYERYQSTQIAAAQALQSTLVDIDRRLTLIEGRITERDRCMGDRW